MDKSETNLYGKETKLYSRNFIIVYGTIFSVFLAVFLTSSNLKSLDRKRSSVILFGLLYSFALMFSGMYLGSVYDLHPVLGFYILPLLFNFIYMMVQDKIVLEPITPAEYNKKNIAKPILIGIGIPVICGIASVIIVLGLMINYGAIM